MARFNLLLAYWMVDDFTECVQVYGKKTVISIWPYVRCGLLIAELAWPFGLTRHIASDY